MRTCSRSWDQEGHKGFVVYSCCSSMNHSVPAALATTWVIVCTEYTVDGIKFGHRIIGELLPDFRN